MQRSTISKGAALHISSSIANQLVLNLPAFLHFTEHTVHSWRGEQPGWVAHGQIEDVAKARPRAELKVFSEQSARCHKDFQICSVFFLTRTLHVTTSYKLQPCHFRRQTFGVQQRHSSGSEPFTAALSRSGAINITASELCPKPVPSPWHKNADLLQPSKADCFCRLYEETFLYIYMSAKHQENDTPVKASHLLLVIAVCPVLVPEHCLLGEPPKHEKFVSFHKSSVEW